MFKKLYARFSEEREGSIAVEFAFLIIILATMTIGALDFGLAYVREMAMSNAVRSGTQFALARRPSIGPETNSTLVAQVSRQTIRDAVVASAPFLDTDPGAGALDVTVFCECVDGTSVTCLSSGDVPLSCDVRSTYLQIILTLPYEMIFNWPGFGGELNLSSDHVIRLS